MDRIPDLNKLPQEIIPIISFTMLKNPNFTARKPKESPQ